MRTILSWFFMVMAAFCFAEEGVTPEGIEAIKQKIVSHEEIAKQAERKAERLMSQDYSSYRRYIDIRDRNLAIAEALKEKLAELENLPPHLQEKSENFRQ